MAVMTRDMGKARGHGAKGANESWKTAWEARAKSEWAGHETVAALERAHRALLSPEGGHARAWLRSLGLDGLDARRWGLGYAADPRLVMPGIEIDGLWPAGYVVAPMVDVDGEDEPCLAATPVGGDPRSAIMPERDYTPILDNGLLGIGAEAVCAAMSPLEAVALSRALGEPAVAIVGEDNAYVLARIISSAAREDRPRRVDIALGRSPERRRAADGLADLLVLTNTHYTHVRDFPCGDGGVFGWLAAARHDAGRP